MRLLYVNIEILLYFLRNFVLPATAAVALLMIHDDDDDDVHCQNNHNKSDLQTFCFPFNYFYVGIESVDIVNKAEKLNDKNVVKPCRILIQP